MTTNVGLALTAAFTVAAMGAAGIDSVFFLKTPLFAIAEQVSSARMESIGSKVESAKPVAPTPDADKVALGSKTSIETSKALETALYKLVELSAQSELSHKLDQNSVTTGQVLYLPIVQDGKYESAIKGATKVEITKAYTSEINDFVDAASGKALIKRCVDATFLNPIIFDRVRIDLQTPQDTFSLKAVCSDVLKDTQVSEPIVHDVAQTVLKSSRAAKFPLIGPIPPSRF